MTGRAFDPGEPIGYQAAGEWLEAYALARANHDGDPFVGLFTDGAELRPGPFGAPMAGALAIRAYLGQCARVESDADLTIERHWVSGATILAPWHMSFVRLPDRRREEDAGFLTAEMLSGRCNRLRLWVVRKDAAAG